MPLFSREHFQIYFQCGNGHMLIKISLNVQCMCVWGGVGAFCSRTFFTLMTRTSKFYITGPFWEESSNPPMARELPSQRASDVRSVSMLWSLREKKKQVIFNDLPQNIYIYICIFKMAAASSAFHAWKYEWYISICLMSGNMKQLVAKWPCCFKDILSLSIYIFTSSS